MPLFGKRQSNECKKKLQHQLYLAKEDPEPTFDLSLCQLSDVPSGVYSLCKVLQKETLLLNDNWLTTLKGGGAYVDMETLRVLDLHSNELTTIPEEICCLKLLQVLNVENNKLRCLPETIGSLESLQTLNVKGNKLKKLPDSVGSLKCLRTLDVSNNSITQLPQSVANCRTLDNIILDAHTTKYPDAKVCSEGTEAIMRFLCSECGIEYEPPSKFLLDTLSVPCKLTRDTPSFRDNAFSKYEVTKERKRKERMMLEKQLEEEQKLQAEVASQAALNKQHLIQYMAQDQRRLQGELNALQQQKEEEHQKMVSYISTVEKDAEELVKKLLEMNEKARRTEELLEKMDRERMEKEQWFIVRQEETESLRKNDVIVNMEKILAEAQAFEALRNAYETDRENTNRKVQESLNDTEDKLGIIMKLKEVDNAKFTEAVLKEEQLQKEAFEVLQLQKDAKHQRLYNQIELIQKELAQMTLLEVENENLKMETKKGVLKQHRQDLTDLLVQLMEEKNKRVLELRQRLLEMEEKKLDDQVDYWLVQYQRLMDRKPQAMVDQERQLEYSVISIIENASAASYIPVFARHRISIETMLQLTDNDLKQMGVHELGIRRDILRSIEQYTFREQEARAAEKLAKLEEPEQEWLVKPPAASDNSRVQHPSAPPSSEAVTPTEVTARGLNTECVVCMEVPSVVLFLNCGHVCCCSKCAEPLQECPLCRGAIVQRIRLQGF